VSSRPEQQPPASDPRAWEDGHPPDEVLFDAAEGKLPRRERRRVEAHLASCAACAELVQGAQAGQQAAATLPAPTLSAEDAAALHVALDREWAVRAQSRTPRRRWAALPAWRRRLNVGLAMALVATVLGGVAVSVQRDGSATSGGEASGDRSPGRTAGPAGREGPANDAGGAAESAATPDAAPGTDPTAKDQRVAEPMTSQAERPVAGGQHTTVSATIQPPRCGVRLGGHEYVVPSLPARARRLTEQQLGPIGNAAVVCYSVP
jgi:anti-sigma factor RsiW